VPRILIPPSARRSPSSRREFQAQTTTPKGWPLLILVTPETEDDSLRLPGQPQGSPCLCRSKKLSVSSGASACALLQSPAVWLVRIAMESAYCLKESHPKLRRPPLAMELAMRVAEVTVCVGTGAPGFLANDSLSASPVSAKSANNRINTGDLWWAWVDLNHRPRPYQGRGRGF
jgi:hypothetical protein